MKKVTMTELRKIQLDILEKVHTFCIERGIRYSLGGGTLLGAVRHEGYIPWDDDIDIMMPRPDYERFLVEFEGMYPYYVLQHYKNDENYCFPFAKIYDDRTILLETVKSGIYIDVFPIDGLPDASHLQCYLKKQLWLINSIGKTNKYYRYQKGNKIWLYAKYLLKIALWGYISRNTAIVKLDNLHNSYPFDTSFYAGAIVGRYGKKEVMRADIFKHYVKLSFEKHEYMAIADYDLYLTQHYGNYMQLPPIENQVSWHKFEAWWKPEYR